MHSDPDWQTNRLSPAVTHAPGDGFLSHGARVVRHRRPSLRR